VAEGQFSLNLVDGPVYNFQVTAPNGGESFKVGQDVNITWTNGPTAVDYYNIGYLYYKNGVLSFGSVGTAMWGTSNMHWIIPQELANQKVKIFMDPRLNGISVGQDTSDNYFSVAPANISLSNQLIQGGVTLAIQYNWNPSTVGLTNSLMIWNGDTCKSFAGGYKTGDLFTSIGIGATNQYTLANVGIQNGKTFCSQLWSDFYGGVSISNPSVIIIGIQGDTDGDGHVTIFDFNTVVTDFGKTGTGLAGDVDGNGKVDIFDFNIVVTNFGR
jgi:hypothetical protein